MIRIVISENLECEVYLEVTVIKENKIRENETGTCVYRANFELEKCPAGYEPLPRIWKNLDGILNKADGKKLIKLLQKDDEHG